MKPGELLRCDNRPRQGGEALMLPADQRCAFHSGKNGTEFLFLMQRPGQIHGAVQLFGKWLHGLFRPPAMAATGPESRGENAIRYR